MPKLTSAIDPASEANAPYRDGLVSGAYLSADDREGILILPPHLSPGTPFTEAMAIEVKPAG